MCSLVLLVVLSLAAPTRALADERHAKPERDFGKFTDWLQLAAGAAAGFVGHELGHVTTDVITGHHPTFVRTHTGPFPFFAIQPCCGVLSRSSEYAIASAGFIVGDVSSELIFHLVPNIRTRHAPFLKGILLFDTVLAVGYAVTGFLEARWPDIGPAQSDINSMARALGVPPWQVGLYLMTPALIDVYRYFVPGSPVAPWVSLQGKAMMLGITLPLL